MAFAILFVKEKEQIDDAVKTWVRQALPPSARGESFIRQTPLPVHPNEAVEELVKGDQGVLEDAKQGFHHG
jgi:hypothetical protein